VAARGRVFCASTHAIVLEPKADADFQLAHQNCICEIALVAESNLAGFADGELHAVHRAVFADHKRAEKSLECRGAFDV